MYLKEAMLFLKPASAKSPQASQHSVDDFTHPSCSDLTAHTSVHPPFFTFKTPTEAKKDPGQPK